MRKTAIIPGLSVDEALYEAAASGLVEHAPEVGPLTWERWVDPQGWTLVPDEQTLRPYKAELTLREHPVGTLRRMNIWYEPDLRGTGQPNPHSHPWPFVAHVLLGGYTEHRYSLTGGSVDVVEAAHQPGDANNLPGDLFHEVTEIHGEPGQTLTLMVVTAPGVRGGWGYLSPDTGVYTAAPPASSAFLAALRALNPHR